MQTGRELAELLDRLTRLYAAGRRNDGLNDTQAAALLYLSRANRYSRQPSAVADYLAATRGTVSQTLKALERKGLVSGSAAAGDRRSHIYSLTEKGLAAADRAVTLPQSGEAAGALRRLLTDWLAARGGRSFGLCNTCRHHSRDEAGAYCRLLRVRLLPEETELICREHEAAG